MKFKYVGKDEEMNCFGHDFSDGATPDVTSDHAIQKLSNNRFFIALKDEDDKEEKEGPIQDPTQKELKKEETKPSAPPPSGKDEKKKPADTTSALDTKEVWPV